MTHISLDHWPSDNTYRAVRAWLENALVNIDVTERVAIIRQLLQWYTGLNRSELITSDHRFSESDLNRLKSYALRLMNDEPLQYITREAWFMGHPFTVSPAVLIPRPETEELVSKVIAELRPHARVLDIGTGSGCIAISIAFAVENSLVEAWDISSEALEVATENARKLNASVQFECRDVFGGEAQNHTERYDAIVSNPPYILRSEADQMEVNVTEHEPHVALFVDHDPLIFYKKIVQLAEKLLAEAGLLAFECHRSYANEVFQLCLTAGWSTEIHQDAQGNDRVVIARRSR